MSWSNGSGATSVAKAAGGNASFGLGSGGAGGVANASSAATSGGAELTSSSASASGGDGGGDTYQSLYGGLGGFAAADSTAIAYGGGNAASSASATGGNGGGGAVNGGSGGGATAAANAVAFRGGSATATATATGAAGGSSGSGLAGAQGSANATSLATAQGGALAQAQSTAVGSSGQAKSTAQSDFHLREERSVLGHGSSRQHGDDERHRPGRRSGQAFANPGQTAYAFSVALPDKAYVTSLIGGANNVEALCSVRADVVFGDGHPRRKLRGRRRRREPPTPPPRPSTSAPADDLKLGLIDNQQTGFAQASAFNRWSSTIHDIGSADFRRDFRQSCRSPTASSATTCSISARIPAPRSTYLRVQSRRRRPRRLWF